MKILAVDGVPVRQEKEPEANPISTGKKIQILKTADEDLEWYPTTPEIMEKIICDRCGKDITEEFYAEGGNCTCCGDNLCAECAGEWTEHGECQKCQLKLAQGERA